MQPPNAKPPNAPIAFGKNRSKNSSNLSGAHPAGWNLLFVFYYYHFNWVFHDYLITIICNCLAFIIWTYFIIILIFWIFWLILIIWFIWLILIICKEVDYLIIIWSWLFVIIWQWLFVYFILITRSLFELLELFELFELFDLFDWFDWFDLVWSWVKSLFDRPGR